MTGSQHHQHHITHPTQQQQQQRDAHAPPPHLKPIRFITNDGGPYAKRRRISSACHTCRRRKTRCSGERPKCDTCKQGGHECKGYGPGDGDAVTSPNVDHHEHRTNTNINNNNIGDMKENTRHSGGGIGKGQQQHHHHGRSPTKTTIANSGRTEPPRRPSFQHANSIESNDSTPSAHLGNNDDGALSHRTDSHSTSQASSALTLSIRNRMPYFRYFGPTAIMPGFKQMVVKVHENRGTTATSSAGDIRGSSPKHMLGPGRLTPTIIEAPTPIEPPVYDTSITAPSPLIIHLCQTFFTHLGCSFPFLQKDRFMRDLEEKQVDAILVDAVCALAARFSNDPELTGKNRTPHGPLGTPQMEIPPPERGQAFAHRAKSSIVDLFPCPSVAVVQAALLLAYDEFGANRDSGLWMYLGIAIRMAQDLGMQKLEGLRYIGLNGPTPQSLKFTRKRKRGSQLNPPRSYDMGSSPENDEAVAELKAIERERVDTFWAVFSLDRYISSGTGRPVTLRDEDIEVAFPPLDEIDPDSGWPLPWPALIRIVHLYGRVSDVLNGIKEVSHVTPDVITRLGIMEKNLTEIYQGLLPKLHFNAFNFQYYASVGQGTNFIMLHFWFHTLIVLLHQPTLLHTFEDEIQQLFPKSRELSMSSAKTIADILSFAELVSGKSALGNPFTRYVVAENWIISLLTISARSLKHPNIDSQPTYIAACAFLKESASHAMSSKPPSRAASPSVDDNKPSRPSMSAPDISAAFRKNSVEKPILKSSVDQQLAAKHSLLASAANQNYQRCYRALQQLESYWAGTKYILTVLDQKAKGVVDPILYTREEMESALEAPNPEPSFTAPGWRRKQSWGMQLGAQPYDSPAQSFAGTNEPPTPAIIDPGPGAIGWSLTGTMNSPKNASLAVLYPPNTRDVPTHSPNPPMLQTPTMPQAPMVPPFPRQQTTGPLTTLPTPSPNFNNNNAPPKVEASRIQDADLLLNLTSPYNQSSPQVPNTALPPPSHLNSNPNPGFVDHQAEYHRMQQEQGNIHYGNMMIESQDIDMSVLGDDMMWLEYLPSEPLNNFYGTGGNHGV